MPGNKTQASTDRLLAALGLRNVVRAAIIVGPGVDAGRGIELPRVGQQWLQLRLGKQGSEDGPPRNMVKGADGVN